MNLRRQGELMEMFGGKMVVLEATSEDSSTKIIGRIVERFGGPK